MKQRRFLLFLFGIGAVLALLVISGRTVVKSYTTTTVTYVYRMSPTGFVCGTTGDSPGIVGLQIIPEDYQHEVETRTSKCNGTNFGLAGDYDIWIDMNADGSFDNGTDYIIRSGSYSAGEDVIRKDIDPVEHNIYGPHDVMIKLYSDDQPTIPKHTGVIRVWEEYSQPNLPQHDKLYGVETVSVACGNIIKGQFTPNNSTHEIDVSISKCDGSDFGQGGRAYVYVDGTPVWGPFTYQSGGSVKQLGSIDPIDLNIWGTHNYKVVAYSNDQPTNPNKYSGNVQVWETEPETVPPDGNITSPTDGATIGPMTVNFTADAWDNNGGSGVNRVKFEVLYDGVWHDLGNDNDAPYQFGWETPTALRSQQIQFSIDVVDNTGNTATSAGGLRTLNFVESVNNPSVIENWVPDYKRAYLNQRALPNGDIKCGATSMAMVLAMNGIIASDYTTMAAKANEMYPNTLVGNVAYVYKMTNELGRQGAISSYYYDSADDGWNRIKQEVDAGRPLILRTENGVMTGKGHIFVIVGYREEGADRQIIAYDPYGIWQGHCCTNNYNKNDTDASSHKGKQVYYNFSQVFGSKEYLITVQPKTSLSITANTPITPPDLISDEPQDIGTYEGIDISTAFENNVFLPFIER